MLMQYPVVLATTHHDPEGRLYEQTTRLLPRLRDLYAAIAVISTPVTPARDLDALRAAGIEVLTEVAALPVGMRYLGLWRRRVLERALQLAPEAQQVHFCDLDRVLHWLEFYPDELHEVLAAAEGSDFVVLGRTARAFETHPVVQRATEQLINHTFALASGVHWDVTAGSRTISRRAAEALLADCPDETVGCDCSWPLFLWRRGGFAVAYRETEGLEFETLDRYADEVAALGGAHAWLAQMDADPGQWAQRLAIAAVEAESAAEYRLEVNENE
jgi:hypothetical protein